MPDLRVGVTSSFVQGCDLGRPPHIAVVVTVDQRPSGSAACLHVGTCKSGSQRFCTPGPQVTARCGSTNLLVPMFEEALRALFDSGGDQCSHSLGSQGLVRPRPLEGLRHSPRALAKPTQGLGSSSSDADY